MSERKQKEITLKFCPNCGESLLKFSSFLNEYWISDDTAYFCWCGECSWRGEIIEIRRVTAPELSNL